jgi:predicted kinase
MPNNKVIVMRGLPGSGKSTRAKEYVAFNKNTYRINRDSLRQMLYCQDFNPKLEKIVTKAENLLAEELIKAGYNIVSDNMNLSEPAVNLYRNLANEYGADFEVVKMETSVEDCIRRDAARGILGQRCVGKDVILNLANKFKLVKQEKSIAIFDLDGTLADISKRVHYVKNKNNAPDWKAHWGKFFAEVGEDGCRWKVRDKLLDCLHNGFEIIICSGRPEKTRNATILWLAKHEIPYGRLIMRPDTDNQDDTTLKQYFLDNFIDKSKIVYIADDRPKVIRMWRSNGLPVEDFGDGIEF